MSFLDMLKNKPVLLLDGAMGTELDKRGQMARGRTNLDAPEVVSEIHAAYMRAGCDAVTTNTLTMNRVYIETHDVGVSAQEINRAGVELACQASGCAEYVLGDMSSTGQLLEPLGTYTEGRFCQAFREQAKILTDAGVDALLVETMFDLREAVVAVRACGEVSSLPVLASISFQTEAKGGRTMMGDTAEQCASQLAEAGAAAIGANCGDLDPIRMAQVVSLFKQATDLPILAQPNAGLPELVEGKTVFRMGPEAFAQGIAACVRAGARIVGGCCGTTPEHIRAVRRMLDNL